MKWNKQRGPLAAALFLALGTALSVSAEDHYVSSVAKGSQTWLLAGEEGATIPLPSGASERQVSIKSNLAIHVSQRPYWVAAAVDGTTIKLSVRANTAKIKREGSLVVKTKDGHQLTITLVQATGTEGLLTVNKDQLVMCSDHLQDSLQIASTMAYTLDVPSWLEVEDLGGDKYRFSANRVYDQSSQTGSIGIKNSAGDVVKSVAVTNNYASSEWYDYPCFGVISDIHTGHTTEEGYLVKLPRVLRNLSKHEPKIRNLFVIGDLADHCYEAEYKEMMNIFRDATILDPSIQVTFIRGNHDNFRSDGATLFKNIVGQNYNDYQDIQGYPFISMGSDASDYRGTECYNDASESWLKACLADAADKYPNKPIFVFQHILPVNTVVGSYTNDALAAYATGLDEMFAPYPQVVDFSGHTHLSIYDPHQIYQLRYTAVNDGGERTNWLLTHSPKDVSEHATIEESVTEGLVCHFDKDKNFIMERWNTALNKHYAGDWTVFYPFDETNFKYKGRTGGESPWWSSGATLAVTNMSSSSCKISFPQALDDEEVYRYLIDVCNSAGTKVISTINQFSLLNRNAEFESGLTIPLSSLPSGTQLTAKVVALDGFDQQSPALTAVFTLPAE